MTRAPRSGWVLLAALFAATLLMPGLAHAQWQAVSADGKTTLNLGFLAQFQGEELQATGADYWQQNVFARRLRIIGGSRLNDRVALFFETDSPNLGKAGATGAKTDNSVLMQDFVLTYSVCPEFKLDAGMLLVPSSHNSQQSAATLLALDYGPYSFLQSDPTKSKVGRDYGVGARGYLAGRHVEYRALLLQGDRGSDARGALRTAGRAVWYPFEADTGLFYTGTTLGKRRIVSLGASIDAQQDYATWSGDLFVDLPLAGGDGITLQGDYTRYDGGRTFAALPRQDVMLVEAGYFAHRFKLTPFVQYAQREFDAGALADEAKVTGGVAWWGNGHRFNVKLAAAQLTRDGVSDGTQAVLQWQVFWF